MRLVCPHCGQEYPEMPDDSPGKTSQCVNCHQNFVIEKVRFCGDCGTANAAGAAKCRQCGKDFASQAPQMTTAPQAAPVPPPVHTFRQTIGDGTAKQNMHFVSEWLPGCVESHHHEH